MYNLKSVELNAPCAAGTDERSESIGKTCFDFTEQGGSHGEGVNARTTDETPEPARTASGNAQIGVYISAFLLHCMLRRTKAQTLKRA